jgi:hypothetical protein
MQCIQCCLTLYFIYEDASGFAGRQRNALETLGTVVQAQALAGLEVN